MKLKIIGFMSLVFTILIPFTVLADTNTVDKSDITANSSIKPNSSDFDWNADQLIDGNFSYDNGWDNSHDENKNGYADLTFNESKEISQINIGLSSGLSSYQPREGFDVYISQDGKDFRRAFGMDNQYFTEIQENTINIEFNFKKQDVKKVRIQYRGEGNRGRITEIDFLHEQSDNIEPYSSMIDADDYIDSELTDIDPPGEVTDVTTDVAGNSIELNYTLPDDDDFSNVNIYVNGDVYEVKENNFTIENLEGGTDYDIDITTIDVSGNESTGISLTEKTQIPTAIKEVENVHAEVKQDQVDLSWDLPETTAFHHVNVYRKSIEESETSFNFFSPMTVSAATTEDYDPIFETNGTYFNDLTVESETTYEYLLTTEFEGAESEGVTVQATTPEGLPEIGGGDFEEQENGDYLVTWEDPTTGEVNIIVGGEPYATVPASDMQFTVPASDMAYTPLGEADVGIQAVTENGTPGDIENNPTLGDTSLPFSVKNLIESGNGLLWLVGSFILLALSFLLVPKLIRLIKRSFKSGGHEKGQGQGAEASNTGYQAKMTARQEKQQEKLIKQQRKEKESQRIGRSYKESRQQKIKPLREARQPREKRQPREPRIGRG